MIHEHYIMIDLRNHQYDRDRNLLLIVSEKHLDLMRRESEKHTNWKLHLKNSCTQTSKTFDYLIRSRSSFPGVLKQVTFIEEKPTFVPLTFEQRLICVFVDDLVVANTRKDHFIKQAHLAQDLLDRIGIKNTSSSGYASGK